MRHDYSNCTEAQSNRKKEWGWDSLLVYFITGDDRWRDRKPYRGARPGVRQLWIPVCCVACDIFGAVVLLLAYYRRTSLHYLSVPIFVIDDVALRSDDTIIFCSGTLHLAPSL